MTSKDLVNDKIVEFEGRKFKKVTPTPYKTKATTGGFFNVHRFLKQNNLVKYGEQVLIRVYDEKLNPIKNLDYPFVSNVRQKQMVMNIPTLLYDVNDLKDKEYPIVLGKKYYIDVYRIEK